MNPLIGRQLGTYRLIRQLGGGGFADVYLGKHTQTNWDVAIKVLKINYPEATFRQEADILWKLNNPHIVKIMGYDIENGISYLVMEYAEQGSLRDMHRQGEVLVQPLILEYVKQIAGALDYMHRQHLVHCDIKPQNFLMRANNEVILGDFGIATEAVTTSLRLASLPSSPKPLVGTLHYIAPEQWEGHNPTPATDQYALGVVVYEWLCGRRPFVGSNVHMVAQAHMYNAPPPFNDNSISAGLEDVVIHALQKDPKARFPSILDFAQALDDAMQQRPIFASQPSPNQGMHPNPISMWEGLNQPLLVNTPPIQGGLYGNPAQGGPHNSPTERVTPLWQTSSQPYSPTGPSVYESPPKPAKKKRQDYFEWQELQDAGNLPFLLISGILDLSGVVLLFVWLHDLNLALGLPLIAIGFQVLCAAARRREIALRCAWILTAYEAIIILALMINFVSTSFYIIGVIIGIGAWVLNDIFYARRKY